MKCVVRVFSALFFVLLGSFFRPLFVAQPHVLEKEAKKNYYFVIDDDYHLSCPTQKINFKHYRVDISTYCVMFSCPVCGAKVGSCYMEFASSLGLAKAGKAIEDYIRRNCFVVLSEEEIEKIENAESSVET